MTTIPSVSVPLKQRFYKYRNIILRTQKQDAHTGDQQYWEIKNLAPEITQLNPTAIAKGTAFNLVVEGSAFDDKAVIVFGSTPHVTINYSDTQLVCQIDAAAVANAGNYPVTVHGGNGQLSNQLNFDVTPN